MPRPTILVTGAGGFIGGRLAEVLFQGGDVDVRAGIRRWASAARLARLPLTIVSSDIMDCDQLAAAMDGVDLVVHCAYNDQRDVIVEGTRNVLDAAVAVGARHVVYMSSAEVYGAATGDVDERHGGGGPFSNYAAAKREAEALCGTYQARSLPVTILRPSIVHGPFSQRTIKFAQRLVSGKWGVFGQLGEGHCNLIYIDDVVDAVLAVLDRPAAFGETFNLNGPEVISWNDYFRRFNDALGRPALATYSPRQSAARTRLRDGAQQLTSQARGLFGDQLMAVYLRGGAASRAMKRVKKALFTTPSGRELQGLFNRDAYYTAEKISDRVGFRPRFDVNTSLTLCAAWLAHHGYLTAPDADPADVCA